MDIEEDINILENLKKYLNLLIYEGTHKIIYNDLDWDEKTIDCINAIEHILAEREEDKKIEQLIAMGVKSINISKEKYNSLKQETKNLIKLNAIKINFIKEEGKKIKCKEN